MRRAKPGRTAGCAGDTAGETKQKTQNEKGGVRVFARYIEAIHVQHRSHLQLDLGDGVKWDPAGLCAGLAEGLVPHKCPSVVGHEADHAAGRLLGAAAVVLEDLEAVREHNLHGPAVRYV